MGARAQEEETREQEQAPAAAPREPAASARLCRQADWLTGPDRQSQGVSPGDSDGNTHEK